MTGRWVFVGRVLPESSGITLQPSVGWSIRDRDDRWRALLKLHIQRSQLVIEAEVKGEPPDVMTLRNEVVDAARAITDFFAFSRGQWVDLHIESVLTPSGELMLFDGKVPVLWDTSDTRPLPQLVSEEDSDDGLRRLSFNPGQLGSVISACEPFLRHALADLREAIGMRATDTPFYCYRALESLRQFFMSKKGLDRKDREAAWKAMHEELRTSRNFIADIEKRAISVRHGAPLPITDAERAECLLRTWTVVYRFFVYALQGFRGLDDEFPLLTGP